MEKKRNRQKWLAGLGRLLLKVAIFLLVTAAAIVAMAVTNSTR